MVCGCFCTAWMGQFAYFLKDEVDWRIIALFRCGLALVFAIGLARLAGAKLVVRGSGALWVRGCASSVSLLCTFYALAQIRPAEVMTLTNTFPIWVAFLSWPLLGARPTLSVWLSAACGVVGVILIKLPHLADGGAAWESGAMWAIILALTAAFTSSIAMLGLHRVKDIHPWAIVVHYSGVATVFVLAAWNVGPAPDMAPLADGRVLLLLLGVAVAATLGQVCVTRAFTSGPPARVAVVGLSQVLFALGIDLAFTGTALAPITLAGIALVLAPTAWVMAGRRVAASPARTDAPAREVLRPPFRKLGAHLSVAEFASPNK